MACAALMPKYAFAAAHASRRSEGVKESRNKLFTTETQRHRELKRKGPFSAPLWLMQLIFSHLLSITANT
jgi:hypothetical protein